MKKIIFLSLLGFGCLGYLILFTETTVFSSEPLSFWSMLQANHSLRENPFPNHWQPSRTETDSSFQAVNEPRVETEAARLEDEDTDGFSEQFEREKLAPFLGMNVNESIDYLLDAFHGESLSKEEIFNLLVGFRYKVYRADSQEAVAALTSFLDSGDDVRTGVDFALQIGGAVDAAPSLRIFALSLLGTLDVERGAELGTQVLNTSDLPDEWAISFQNLLQRGTQGDRAFAGRKIDEMLHNREWLANPSSGFLESFDVLVHLAKTDSVRYLGELHGTGRRELEYATYTALHNLAQKAPDRTLRELNDVPQVLANSPELRADLFAIADIRSADDRREVERYLLREDLTREEMQKFIGVYPNLNSFSGANFFTDYISREAYEKDYSTYSEVVKQWLDDPKFEHRRDEMEELYRNVLEWESDDF